MKKRLVGGLLITENGIEEKDLLISNGKIESLLDKDAPDPADCIEIDCEGNYVSAGFVDIHQHGGGGGDYMDCETDTYLNITNAHLAHGTTSVMPTLLSAGKDALIKAIDAYNEALNDTRIKAHLLGIHLEGRYISPYQAGAQKPENICEFDEEEYSAIIAKAQGNIKRWSVAPEVKGSKRFAEVAKANGITLSIAHSNADFDTVLEAYENGYKHVTHLYSCVSTIVRRDGFRVPGVLEAAYYIDGMNVEIIADGCHLPLSLLSYVAKFKENSRIALITDAMRAAGQNVKTSFLGSADDPLDVIVEDGVAKLTDRSAFAGSVATADRLIRNMVKSGVDIPNAVRMMTVNPIKMMGLNVKKGELREGFDADICVFDGDINIKAVYVSGEKVDVI